MFELHPEAIKSFNDRAENLLTEIQLCELKQQEYSFKTDPYVTATLTDKDIIGDPTILEYDYFGKTIAKYFPLNGKRYGFNQTKYEHLRLLAEAIFKKRSVNKFVSKETIENLIFEWAKEKFKEDQHQSFITYLNKELNTIVIDNEVWIPIYACVESNFKIANIEICPLSKEQWDFWTENMIQSKPNNIEDVRTLFSTKQAEHQGFAASVYKNISEPKRASELAIEETKRALDCLRIYSPHIVLSGISSTTVVKGSEYRETVETFSIQQGMLLGLTESIINPCFQPWAISTKEIQSFFNNGLNVLDKILKKTERSQFEKDVLDSVFLYSRSALARETSDKLLYILASLEKLLLKDNTEPIQQNLGERLSFCIGKDVEERKKIIKNIKNVYKIRSSFFHHGINIYNQKTLNEFLLNVRSFYLNLLQMTENFSQKSEFINKIEEEKLS